MLAVFGSCFEIAPRVTVPWTLRPCKPAKCNASLLLAQPRQFGVCVLYVQRCRFTEYIQRVAVCVPIHHHNVIVHGIGC